VSDEQVVKVAVLGGGMGSLAAVWRMVHHPPPGVRYEITVYQRDGLLGGKGASTRSSRKGEADRIHEHGIHVLMGWYDVSVGMLREAYAKLDRDGVPDGIGSVLPWDEVLSPASRVTMGESPETTGRGEWDFWHVDFPSRPGEPGQAPPERDIPSLIRAGLRWLRWFRGGLVDAVVRHRKNDTPTTDAPALPDRLSEPLEVEGMSAEELAHVDMDGGADKARQASADHWMHRLDETIGAHVEALATWARAELVDTDPDRPGAASGKSLRSSVRRWFTVLWFAGTLLRGLTKAGVTRRADLDALDHLDFREWLKETGGIPWLRKELMWDSPPIRILYDMAFAHGRTFAAGTLSYGVMLFAFGYRGAFSYKMQGGMGDIVFAPLYLALRDAVDFRFFHDVEGLYLKQGRIEEIALTRTQKTPDDWMPLRRLDLADGRRLAVWPDVPPPGTMAQASGVSLRRGEDFDEVVLGISVAGIRELKGDLLQQSPRLARAVQATRTVRTQAAQLWLNTPMVDVGWRGSALLASFVRPMNSVVDMSHVLDKENWPKGTAQALVYMADAASDDLEGDDTNTVRGHVQALLTGREGRQLWPNVDLSMLVAAPGDVGQERLGAQYFRLNSDPSDRYVLAEKGTLAARVGPGDTGIDNLVVAGDWVATEINAGCLEAAARAGVAAADAIATRRGPSLPRFVDMPWDWVRPQPYDLDQSQMWAFPLRAQAGPLLRYCREMVDGPTAGAFSARPLPGNFVLLVFAKVDEGRSDPERRDGFLVENEVAIFVPIRLKDDQGRERIDVLVPSLYVDNAASVVAGREIYGFPKLHGEVIIDDQDARRFEARSLHLHPFDPGSKAKVDTVIRVSRDEGAVVGDEALSGSWAEACEVLAARIAQDLGGDDKRAFGAPFVGPINLLRLLFLRQLRDPSLAAAASWQELVEANAPVENVRQARLLKGPFHIEMANAGRPRLAEPLGLVPPGAGHPATMVARFGFKVAFDFGIGRGRSLWRR